ncbi:MAG: two component transcriptional regulator, LuxR family [Betaproteobacteria bacterium]|nr:two component transcriptional regulator, LuxR family [Betaproteobacteria bacterium]
MAKLRVLLADDHAILRDGLAVLINGQSDMEVVAQASNGAEAIRLAKESRIDVAVLDVSMPGVGGAEAAQQIRDCCGDTRVLALTRHANTGYLRRLLQAGANGYVLKKSAADALINAIRIVAQGGTYLEPSLAGAVLGRAFGPGGASDARESRDFLTLREEEVLRSIAWGRSNKEIATELDISIKTVESYKAAAIEKLDLRSRADIVRYAVSRGWLSEDTSPE